MSGERITVCYAPAAGAKSRALLDRALTAVWGKTAAAWALDRTAQGKPYFPQQPDHCFSISHSGAWWACALGRRPLGLDVQQHVPCRCQRLAERFFHPQEAAWLAQRQWQAGDFFTLWAAKESYVKYTGQGLCQGLDSFSLTPPPPAPQLYPIDFAPGYSMCLCADRIDRVQLLALT